ncbi:MAG TPA: periplasmic heavy metal sensor [Pyrinomonadaceae bacterium]|nr:periplasmic heavy metal sensor [Pyrinomonadaceae bacterium]
MRFSTPPLPAAVFGFIITIACCANVLAQEPQPPQNPPPTVNDPIQQLHLTPEQRQKIRTIRESSREERAVINQRLRDANIALEQALDADNPDDATLEQRLREAAAAQAASMRMRIQTEVKIRRVLTQEQLATLRMLRLQARELNRDQNQNPRPVRQGNVLRPNQRNGMAPLFPRRDGAQRKPRP